MTVFLAGKRPSAHRRRLVNPNSRRAESARARNKNPCVRCKHMRQKCTREGGRACSQCVARNLACEPGRPEPNPALSIQTTPRFIFEDGQSRQTQSRYRSNTVQTIDSVASPVNEENQESNIFSPTSPTVQFPSAYNSTSQSPTSELRFMFGALAFDESRPLEDEHACGPSPHVSNGISQGQLTSLENQSSSMTYNSASSSIVPQTHATSEVVTTTSASVSISGDTINLGTSTFSGSTEYAQGAGSSVHGSSSVIATQDDNWNPPIAPDKSGTFSANLSFPLDPGSLDERFLIALGSSAGVPTGLDSMPLQRGLSSISPVNMFPRRKMIVEFGEK